MSDTNETPDWRIAAKQRASEEMYEALKAFADQGEPTRAHDELWSAWQVRVRSWKSAVLALAKADGKPNPAPPAVPPA